MKIKSIIKVLASAALVLSLAACSSGDSDVTVVKVGVVGAYNDQWETVNEILKEDNIKVELVQFSEYSIPNTALAAGDIDLNAFQHYAFLENQCNANDLDLTPIGDTLIAPLAFFSNKITDIKDIKDGDKIAIPSDATNGGRALRLLEEIGLIECDDKAGELPSKLDITKYNVQIEIIEAESGTLANMLPDVTGAFINGGNAYTAGLNPAKDSIYIEDVDPANNPNVSKLINIIVARTADKDNEVYKKVVEAYHTEAVKETILTAYEGAFIPAWD